MRNGGTRCTFQMHYLKASETDAKPVDLLQATGRTMLLGHLGAQCPCGKTFRSGEEKLGDTIFDEMKRVLAKAWELLGKMEAEGDHRGSIVALCEVRECLGSLNGLVTKAESGSGGISVTVHCIGFEMEHE